MSSPFKLPDLPGLEAIRPHWTNLFNPNTLPNQLRPLRDACLSGDLAACTDFASHFEQGKYVERNMELVSALYEDCCNKGEGACCARKGEYYAKTPEATLSFSCWWKHTTARDLFEKGCEAGDSRSCGALSDLLTTKNCVRDRVGAKKALAKAITVAKQNCFEGKKAHQCWVLGGFLHNAARLEEQSEVELLQQADAAYMAGSAIFEERCRTSGQDCYFLGELLREKYDRTTSRKPKETPARAIDELRQKTPPSAEAVEDLKRAKRAYEDGCLKLNDVESCTALAQMFTTGSPVTVRDAELVMSYLARACRLSPLQCGLLGEFFAEYPQFQPPASEGVAESLFQLACQAGNKPACLRAVRLRTEIPDSFMRR